MHQLQTLPFLKNAAFFQTHLFLEKLSAQILNFVTYISQNVKASTYSNNKDRRPPSVEVRINVEKNKSLLYLFLKN